MTGTALIGSVLSVVAAGPANAAATGGPGASLPYVELQAENAATTGTIIGPSVAYGTLPDEASYRKAVTLSGSGQYVEFTTTAPTNSIDFRYSIPDTGGGSVYTSPLSLSINGSPQSDFTLTNAYSWYYGSYPFTNTPGSNQHHFYDEAHRLLPSVYPAGTKFRLTVPGSATASSTTIDFADFENVPAALPQPAGSVSVTSQGADNTGGADATNAFNAAMTAAGPGGTVWIPAGSYNIPGHIIVNNVTVKGAGMWYSTVKGSAPGFYGGYVPNGSSNVHLSDFAIFGDVQQRDDSAQVNGVGGALNSSTVANIWIEHLKVGAWMDGPFDGLTFSGMRIRDTTADGINFHKGVTNSTVTNSDLRNLGDDGLATWSESTPDANDTFSNNTVQYPILANGIAIYGGHDNFVTGNRVVDAGLAEGGGIHVAQRFASTTLGKTTVSNNTLIRDGSLDLNWKFGVGALWFDARDGSMSGAVTVTNTLIQQSPYEAIMFINGTITNVTINNATIQGTGTYAIQEQAPGSATVANVVATGVSLSPPVFSCEGTQFVLTDGGGNSGIGGAPVCGDPAAAPETFPPYIPEGVSASPGALNFGAVATSTTSAAQTVTVSNPQNTAAAVSSIATTGDFSQTNTCGSSIAANGSCSVNVTFSPSAAGSRTGTLTVNAGGTTSTVNLSGTGVAPGPILNANPASVSFAGTVVGSTTATQAVTVSNSGTTSATVSGVSVTGDFTQTNNCASVAVGASCTVNVAFKPTLGGSRTGTLTVTSNANNGPVTVSLSGSGIDSSTNIAAGKPATASSSNGAYVPGNVTDADASTYWESANGAWPQWLQADLGSPFGLGKLTLKLPPATSWSTRTETIAVSTSTDGTSFTTNVGATAYTFDPATGNTVSINLPANVSGRYVRLTFTANTGWNAGQLSDFEVFPSGGTTSSATLSTSPSSLTFGSTTVGATSGTQTVTVSNTGTAAAAVSGVSVTGDFAQTNTCGSSLAAGASCSVSVTFHPTASGPRTGTLTVTSNATNSPTNVALSGTGATTGTATLSTSPSSLTFASTAVGSASAAQSVTVSNTGTAAASVSSVAVSGDYTQTNTCGSSIAAGGSCTVSVTFRPSASGTRTGSLTVTSSATSSPNNVALTGTGTVTSTNLALNKPTTESSHTQTYASGNVTDGNQATYWESVNNVWPAWVQVDLGSAQSVSRVVLQLPTTWGARNETLSILGSTDGSSFTTLKTSATYTFSPSSNTVTITFTAATQRYIRVNITANNVQPGGQLSELQVWNS
ncbi:MAG: hypothetical protein QOI76_3343 [Frankiales bacterium]|nr:hypothetical protein [Frankiales bacterium]